MLINQVPSRDPINVHGEHIGDTNLQILMQISD